MWRVDRRACATVALVALASLAGIAPIDAQGEDLRERHEHRASEAVRREAAARQSHRTYPARAQTVHAAARREVSDARQRSVGNDHQMHEVSRGLAAGQVRVVRYGNTLSGTVERTIRPGLIGRTFVSGGHVLYTHVYQSHVWHQFGRTFAYETFVPAVRYPGVYYAWTLAAWPRPISYAWGWQVQPWYPIYGSQFTPYPVYTSPDLWMTDYIIAES